MPDKPRRILLPPIVFLIMLGGMWALHRYAPIAHYLEYPITLIGILPILAGLAIGFSSARRFRKRGTGVIPFSPATTVVTDGAYRFTRNPMYLGLTLALIGAALLFGSVSPLLTIPVFIIWITIRYILAEEEFMAESVGQPYLDYKQKVRRWI